MSSPSHTLDLASQSERSKASAVNVASFVLFFLISTPLAHQLLARIDHAEFTVLWMIFFTVGFENIPACLWGQTLGHKVFGLRLVDANGQHPKARSILYRWLHKILVIGRNVDYLDQAIHDEATGVYLVRDRQR